MGKQSRALPLATRCHVTPFDVSLLVLPNFDGKARAQTNDEKLQPGLICYGRKLFCEVMGLNPCTVYWIDRTFFHIDLLSKLYCLFEKTENKLKRGRSGPIYKNYNQNLTCAHYIQSDRLLKFL